MSLAKVCLLLVVVTVAVFVSSTHAQIFGRNRNSNQLQPMCILGRRLAKNRLNCNSNSGLMCTYIKNNLDKCGETGGAMQTKNESVSHSPIQYDEKDDHHWNSNPGSQFYSLDAISLRLGLFGGETGNELALESAWTAVSLTREGTLKSIIVAPRLT
ncbi:hypothetical protein PoB_005786200 [Plakobranchus ocellatus]|uniref:Uncharacterized protein n=1 Tax=Plakobranchus ocellatus TaxID=259542 RepID=A0AAV4CIR1_9GAST|nr:hypothetical protein PoB_005786200 [Plakobranchus ocellatus]